MVSGLEHPHPPIFTYCTSFNYFAANTDSIRELAKVKLKRTESDYIDSYKYKRLR
jgi:hypothetical protein